ncbi:PAS domain S-box protein [Coleofasciculus sp.]|uniref:PAS domain S-box protein n=1 Tax=Coleofasciculus sp. TaxID=3100458 RepID=UPI0039F79EEF
MMPIFGYLWWIGSKSQIERQPGWFYMLAGYALICLDGFMDLVNRTIGLTTINPNPIDTLIPVTLVYLVGFGLLFIGLCQWLPFVAKLKKLEVVSHQYNNWNDDHTCKLYDQVSTIAQSNELKQEIAKCLQTQGELQQSQEQFRAIVQALPVPVAIARISDGKIVYCNSHASLMFGVATSEFLSCSMPDFYENPTDWQTLLATLAKNGSVQNAQVRIHKINDTPLWVTVSMQVLTLNQEKAILSIFNDISDTYQQITQFQQTKAAIIDSEACYRSLVEQSPNAIALDSQGKLVYINPAGVKLLGGVSQNQVIGKPWSDFISQVDEQLVQLDGQIIDVEIARLPAIYQGQGATQLVIRDQTPKEQPDRELRVRARQQAAVAKLSQRALSGLDLNTLMNEAVSTIAQTLEVEYCKILELLPNGNVFLLKAGVGWSPGLVGYALVGAHRNSQAGYTLVSQEPVVVEDLRVETRFSGPPLLYNHRVVSGVSVVIPGQEQPFGVLGTHTTSKRRFSEDDINFLQAIANVLALAIGHKQSEANLYLMQRAIAASNNGVIITDPNQPDNPVIYVNPAFESMTGYTAPEVIGRNCRFWQEPDYNQIGVTQLATAIQEQRECHVILQNYRKDGSLFWNELYVSPVFDGDGYLTHFVGIQSDITQRKQAEEALRQSEEKLESILSSLDDVVWSASLENQQFIYLNPATERVYGRPVSDFVAHPSLWQFVVHPDDRQRVEMASQTMMHKGSKDLEYRVVRPDGEVRWLRDRARLIYDQRGTAIRMDGIATDITKRKQAEAALLKSEEQFRLTFELAPIGMAMTSLDGKFLKVNQALCEALGYTAQELLALTFTEISHPTERTLDFTQHQSLLRGELSHLQTERRYVSKYGRIVNAILKVVLVRDSQSQPLHYISQVVDISDRKRMEEQLLHDAFHDVLTGLPNRALFMDRLEYALRRARQRWDYLCAVIVLDLDRFKVINDSLGHLVGDRLLTAIAHRLEGCLRPSDTLARLGGDEFTILLDDIPNTGAATDIAKSIHQTLASSFNLDGYEVFATASIGIALSGMGYNRAEDLLRDADTAMHRAKLQGTACYVMFDTAMSGRALAQLRLETELRWAIERQELEVYYQPIISLATGKITGFEALVRWQHPEQGMISPGAFIPLAEETGLIIPIGQWVLRTSCYQLRQWQRQFRHYPPLTMSVNLSGKQFSQANLIEQIAQIIQETEVNPSTLKLEITESGIMEHSDSAAALLERLKALNIQLYIDDFGTGYSSLSRLHQFPIDALKIDRSFVSRMGDAGENGEIVQAIVTLAHNLGMDVVAEGIETNMQLAQLRGRRCEYGQGYFFSKPLNRQAAEQLMITLPQW